MVIALLKNAGLYGALLLCEAALATAHSLPQTGAGSPYRAMTVLRPAAGKDSLDQLSLRSIVKSMGLGDDYIHTENIARWTPQEGTVLVIPHASAARMSRREARKILGFIEKGMVIITDGMSPLARLLGVRHGRSEYVDRVADLLRPELGILWSGDQLVPWISQFPEPGSTIVYTDARKGHPLGIILRRGSGACLYLAPLVDPLTDKGYSRFPTLPSVIIEGLGCRPLLSRRAAHAYFDPGYRVGRTAEELARMWRAWGITAIHVAAWYASGNPSFDYAGLIKALHGNGILVYAWLEWPYVGKGFWDSHPAWRQKNALLQDAHLDFLYLMDLQNPACMAEALKELGDLLALDWDGVDVAEFTLTGAGKEALEGPARREYFTGFTESGRREFSHEHGFDPLELFDERSTHYWKADSSALKTFYMYRRDVNSRTERALFNDIRNTDREKKRSRELILTIVDNMLHPEFDDLLGVDIDTTVALVKQLGLTLEVEDPYTEWSKPPDRYTALRAHYLRSLPVDQFMIDVNVVPLDEDRKAGFSTAQATGTEFLQLWHYASGSGGRVCFYCESSVYERDWKLLPFAMAWSGSVAADSDTYSVDVPYTVVLRPGRGARGVALDGEPWPATGDSEITVPAGKHRVRTGMHEQKGMRLVTLTGELTGARWTGDTLCVSYSSTGRCALVFDRTPGTIILDAKPFTPALYRSEGACGIVAPPGRHDLKLSAP
jgi:hypothetical protein